MDRKYKIAANALGWEVYEDFEGAVTFKRNSPAGEDFMFSIPGFRKPDEEVRTFLAGFDADRHAEGRIYLRHAANRAGELCDIPNCEACIKDAKDICNMVTELANAFTYGGAK